MNSEGFIKFNCKRIEGNTCLPAKTFEALTKWRQIMYESCLIGAYSNGIGYGNISIRATADNFYISGTATGRLPALEEKHYPLVNSWSFSKNSLKCTGSINASAESLSHAIIYESLPDVGAVIHIHHKGMWDKYLNHTATTSADVPYGTPEMAKEIQKIIMAIKPNQDPVLVMGGHEEGIIVWGRTLDDAGEIVLKYYKSFLNEK
ncbi:MAG: class II aldolase/adducin family protein [Bacteroidetes bacterium]|nr:class II aldolase/adducin family protein [Bacteroidota bacterium]